MWKADKSCEKYPKLLQVVKDVKNCEKLSTNGKNCKKLQKDAKVAKRWEKLSKVVKSY